jgi:hypothetical protein
MLMSIVVCPFCDKLENFSLTFYQTFRCSIGSFSYHYPTHTNLHPLIVKKKDIIRVRRHAQLHMHKLNISTPHDAVSKLISMFILCNTQRIMSADQ